MKTFKHEHLFYLHLFSYTATCSSFKWIEPLPFELLCTQTRREIETQTDIKTHRRTDGHDYSIVPVDKPQL